jgi:putative tryptophan/tyrosine transport system substrate-binding protein
VICCLKRLVVAAAMVALGATVSGPAQAEESKSRVTILVSHDAAPYRDALKGFQHALQQIGIDAALDVVALEGDASKVAPVLKQAKRDGTSLVFTMGLVATQAALAADPDIPLLAGLILSADPLKKGSNATGLVLEMPMESQLQQFQRLLPANTTVGVLYNPAENRQKVDEAGRAARGKGLRLVPYQVDSPQSLPFVLDSLAKQADVLWGIADSVVVSPETAKTLLVFSFRNHIPFIGLSSAWVKAGALFALDWDYEDVGLQCGELAARVLKGARAGSIAPVAPRRVTYSLNLRTAREMRVVFSESVLNGAANVYE